MKCPEVRFLKYFRELGCESALRFVVAFFASATIGSIALFRSCTRHGCSRRGSRFRRYALRGLRRIGSQDFVLKRGSVETANNRLHFVRCGCFHKRKAFRLLRFMIPDDLNRIRDEVFGGEPLFNVVSRDPNRQIAQKDGKAHSVAAFTPWLGFLNRRTRGGDPISAFLILTDRFARCNVTAPRSEIAMRDPALFASKNRQAAHESSSSRSSRRKSRISALSSPIIAAARSRLLFCSSRTFSSTVSRAIKR